MTQTSTDQAVTEASEGSASHTASIGESLSALVDSEASELEVRRVLKLAETDPDVRARWKRYQLIRTVLHGDLDADPQIDLSGRISAAIAQEDPLQLPGRFKKWGDGIGKVAIAASVAFAFVVGVQQLAPQGQPISEVAESVEPVVNSSAVDVVPSGFELPSFAARTVSTGSGSPDRGVVFQSQLPDAYLQALNGVQVQNNQALQRRFNELLLRHAERSATSGSLGLLPYARVSDMNGVRE